MKVLIDMGHGGVDSNGIYTTAPKKMYRFKTGEIAYEGEINRDLGLILSFELSKMGIKNDFVIDPFNPEDIPLKERVNIINSEKEKHILISLHCNAGGGTGYEQYTTKGITKSDEISNCIARSVSNSKFGLKKRWIHKKDNEYDKESQFYILRKTRCPAVLIECFFFDNKHDYDYMNDYENRLNIMKSIADGISSYISKQ